MKELNNDPSNNNVSDELRLIEQEIDNYYKNNTLVTLPFGTAVWLVMAAYEDLAFSILNRSEFSKMDIGAAADNIVVELQHPLLWLWRTCPKGGKPPQFYDEKLYEEATKLINLANNYDPFYLAYTYASNGWSKLNLNKNVIESSNPFFQDLRYEAYGRLLQQEHKIPDLKSTNLVNRINRSLSISGDRFIYKFGRRIIDETTSLLEPSYDIIFDLPSNWHFEKYSLSEFQRVSKYLIARAFIHKIARFLAASRGIKGVGYLDSLLIKKKDRLAWNIMKYAGIPITVANTFIDDFTYGARNIRHPDPAVQPLIKANNDDYILMPSLLTASSMERNFVILLNKIPETREKYLQLVQDKEDVIRQRIIDGIETSDISYFNGKAGVDSNLPDIDLAIISFNEKIVLVSELKWFIAPAEPREIIEKSEEIRKGINQMLLLQDAYQNNPAEFCNNLSIDESFSIFFIVISENYIGTCIDQHPCVPVIQRKHLVNTINSFGKLNNVVKWLKNREYLPIEDVHFAFREVDYKLGSWDIKWYRIELLVEEFI